jgi:hypothetical protein
MQFPAPNAEPFEFARPVLLLAALSFFIGFGGYVATHPAKAVLAQQAAAASGTSAPVVAASVPAPSRWNRPKKI